MSGTTTGWVLLAMLVLVVVFFMLAGGIARGARDRAARTHGMGRDCDRTSDFAHFPWLLWWSDSSLFARPTSEAPSPRAGSSDVYSSWRDSGHSSARAGERSASHAHDQQHHPGAFAPDPFSLSSGFGTHETASGSAGFDAGFDTGGGAGGSFDSGGGGFDAGACDTGSS